MTDTFYFVAIVDKGKALTVIDLAHCVDYEREDWCTADFIDFDNPQEAIAHAKHLAARNNLQYKRFESRYGLNINEPRLT